MKKRLFVSLFLFSISILMGQHVARQMVAPFKKTGEQLAKKAAPPVAKVLSWFGALPKPISPESIQRAKRYVQSKYRCLRHGEGCSKVERATLATLAALIAAATAALAAKGATKLYELDKRKREESDRENIFNFVRRGNLAGIQRAIKAGASINQIDPNGKTLLMAAAARGYPDIIQWLLENGANINQRDKGGKTALIWAIGVKEPNFDRLPEVVGLLLRNPQIEINLRDVNGETALMWAAYLGQGNIVQILLNAGADWTLKDNRGRSAYDLALTKRIEDMLAEKMGQTRGVAQEVLEKKLPKDILESEIMQKYFALPAQEEKKEASRREQERVKLLAYVRAGNIEAIKKAIEMGVDVNSPGENDSRTPLIEAAHTRKAQILSWLLTLPGINENAQDKSGNTALIEASMYGPTFAVRKLLESGADINIQNKLGLTPLIAVVKGSGLRDALTLLLQQAGIRIDAQDKSGNTALMWASRLGRENMVQILLDAGADWTIRTNQGETAYNLAKTEEVKNMLKEKEASGQQIAVPAAEAAQIIF